MATQTQILATGDTAATSATVTVEQAEMVTVALKDAASTCRVIIEHEDDAGAWQPTGMDLTSGTPTRALLAPGNYRLRRLVGGACGAFKAV